MKTIRRLLLLVSVGFLVLVAVLDAWGYFTLGTLKPVANAVRRADANRVVMVFGATGSVGDGLLKAAIEDPDVRKVYVVTRRSSSRIDDGVASGKVEMRLHEDFTDYRDLADVLGEVSTVLWGLGVSSLQVDDATYTRIQVDFPMAFVNAWLSARKSGAMSFHYVTGIGTDGNAHWARQKKRAERELAALAQNSDLRTYSYRAGFIRPTTERAGTVDYVLAALLRPGSLVITSTDLGRAMLEISARTGELPNGTLIDAADSIAYAKAYREHAKRLAN
jgi:hypothetical protein